MHEDLILLTREFFYGFTIGTFIEVGGSPLHDMLWHCHFIGKAPSESGLKRRTF